MMLCRFTIISKAIRFLAGDFNISKPGKTKCDWNKQSPQNIQHFDALFVKPHYNLIHRHNYTNLHNQHKHLTGCNYSLTLIYTKSASFARRFLV